MWAFRREIERWKKTKYMREIWQRNAIHFFYIFQGATLFFPSRFQKNYCVESFFFWRNMVNFTIGEFFFFSFSFFLFSFSFLEFNAFWRMRINHYILENYANPINFVLKWNSFFSFPFHTFETSVHTNGYSNNIISW